MAAQRLAAATLCISRRPLSSESALRSHDTCAPNVGALYGTHRDWRAGFQPRHACSNSPLRLTASLLLATSAACSGPQAWRSAQPLSAACCLAGTQPEGSEAGALAVAARHVSLRLGESGGHVAAQHCTRTVLELVPSLCRLGRPCNRCLSSTANPRPASRLRTRGVSASVCRQAPHPLRLPLPDPPVAWQNEHSCSRCPLQLSHTAGLRFCGSVGR